MHTLRIIGIIAASVVTGGIIAALLINYVIMPIYVRSGREVEVPDLVLFSVDDAMSTVRELHLVPRVVEHRSDPTVPAGHILSQSPPPGQWIKEGRFVNLVVSQGPEDVEVPAVTGLTLMRARSLLELSGLQLGDTSLILNDSIPVGRIIDSDPPEGALVARGSRINLEVSTGRYRQATFMPNLIGLSLEAALDSLAEHELALGNIEWIPSAGVAQHTVLLQAPQPSTEAGIGDSVQLGVSVMPDNM